MRPQTSKPAKWACYLPKEKQREPLEIMMDMSEFLYSFGPQKITKIERACNLRDDLCKQYLSELQDRQFVKKTESDEYEIIQRGIDFLRDTIELYRKHFPERRRAIEEGRFWRPIRRITSYDDEGSADDKTTT